MFAELQQLRWDLSDTQYLGTVQEIAGALEVPCVMVEYTLEALRLRGYDIDELELTRYDNVFQGWG